LKLRSATAGDDVMKNLGDKAASEALRYMSAPPVQTAKPEQPAQASSPDQTTQPAAPAPAPAPAYKQNSRREMDRLIQNNAQQR